MSFHRGICAAALVALVFAAGARGQSNLATVTGVVTDSADAVIPGAMVSVRNTGTNIERELSTNEVGSYTVTNLNPGDYELTVQSDGFTTHVERGIVLQTGDNRRIDVALQIGQLTESVTVDAQLITLNTENGTIKGDVIVMEEIQELPLSGRDFTDLAFFTPGVVPRGSAQGSFASVNGARPTNTNFYVDGFDNRNPRGGAAQVRPNIDALQEFKMETSGYSAEYGRMAGGILNMTLRAGTNDIHGNLSYFLRDDVLDARGFFEADKLQLRQNQFSATVTGPINKNKTFFMFSYELQRRNQEALRFDRVPTTMELQGDFSKSFNVRNINNSLDWTDPGRDPARAGPLRYPRPAATGGCNINLVNRGVNNSCFPNDMLPASRLDPIAQQLLAEYPGANLNLRRDLFNYRVVDTDTDHFDSYLGKVDHKLGENTLALRAQMRWANNENPFGGSNLPQFGNTIDDDRYLLGADYTHMFSPTDLMELRFGFTGNKTRQRSAFAGQDIVSELGLPNLIPQKDLELTPELNDWPRFLVDNFGTIGAANNQPVQFDTTDFQTSFKMTNIRGNHNIKYGFNYNYVLFQQPGLNNGRGTYRFRGVRTNHQIADVHLGWLHNINRRAGINRPEWRQQAMGAFFNDDWKATRKLTLNLGVRWEMNRMPYDIHDRLASYVPALNQLVLASDRNLPGNFDELTNEFDLTDRISTRRATRLGPLGDQDRLEQPRAPASAWLPADQQNGRAHRLRHFHGRDDPQSVPQQFVEPVPVLDRPDLRRAEQQPGPRLPEKSDAGQPVAHQHRGAGARHHPRADPGVPAIVELHHRTRALHGHRGRGRLPRFEGHAPDPPLRSQPAVPQRGPLPECAPRHEWQGRIRQYAAHRRIQRDPFLQHGVELELQRVQHFLAQAQPLGPLLARELLLVEIDRRRFAHQRLGRDRLRQRSRLEKSAPRARALGLGSQARLYLRRLLAAPLRPRQALRQKLGGRDQRRLGRLAAFRDGHGLFGRPGYDHHGQRRSQPRRIAAAEPPAQRDDRRQAFAGRRRRQRFRLLRYASV